MLPVQVLIYFFLPAFGRDPLVEVPLGIHEPNANERETKIARLLTKVTREHAQAACVNRQRLVQRKLRGEVSDWTLRLIREALTTMSLWRSGLDQEPRSPRRREREMRVPQQP